MKSKSETLFLICGILKTMLISLFLIWVAIWIGVEHTNYVWAWSDNYAVRAAQYLLNFMWGLTWACSPVWWLALTTLSAKVLIKPKTA